MRKALLDKPTLLPCDWCGKPPSIVCPDNSYGEALITCGDANDCPADVVVSADLDKGETFEDAKRRWNTRSSAPQEPDDDAEWLRELATEADELDRMHVALSSNEARRIANRLQAKAPETDGPLGFATMSAQRRRAPETGEG